MISKLHGLTGKPLPPLLLQLLYHPQQLRTEKSGMNLANIPLGELILVLIAQLPNNLLKKSHDLSIIVLVGPALAHWILPVLHILQFNHMRMLHLGHPTIYLHQIIVRVAALVYR